MVNAAVRLIVCFGTDDQIPVVPRDLPPWVPDWTKAIAGWVLQPVVLTMVVSISVVLFVLSLVGAPYVVKRLPVDFFSRPERRGGSLARRTRSFSSSLRCVLKNALGGILLALGVLMLFIPGQGLITILVAMFLLDFPGKRRAQRWAISRPAVHRPLNALRRRAGRPPLELPARS